jgi:hypothetical protein
MQLDYYEKLFRIYLFHQMHCLTSSNEYPATLSGLCFTDALVHVQLAAIQMYCIVEKKNLKTSRVLVCVHFYEYVLDANSSVKQ